MDENGLNLLIFLQESDNQQTTTGKGKLDHVVRIPSFFETEIFSSIWPTVHTCKRSSFYKRSPEWRVLRTLASRLRVDGRRWKRKFSNTMMSYITNITHALWGMLSYSHWTGKTIQIYYLWTRIFFKTEENISPWSGSYGRGLNLS